MEADFVKAPVKMLAWVYQVAWIAGEVRVVREPFRLRRHRRDLPERRGVQARSGRVSAVPGNTGMQPPVPCARIAAISSAGVIS